MIERRNFPNSPLANEGLRTKWDILLANRVNEYLDQRSKGIKHIQTGVPPALREGIDFVMSLAVGGVETPEMGRRLERKIQNELARRKRADIRVVKLEEI